MRQQVMEIKVTVIIPLYNMEQYLEECLETVKNQTLHEIEILCINDGSTDNSLHILEKYSKSDTRFIIINQKNRGVAASRNQGIRMAKGKYVMFMDSDDKYPDNCVIEKLYEAAENHRVKIAGGEFSDFDPDGKINLRSAYENDMLGGYLFTANQIVEYKDYQFDYGYHRFIYDRQFLMDDQIFFPELIRFQDPPFMVMAFTLAERFYAIKEITYCYRKDHKTIIWDEQRVDSLLRGLQMNMRWAWERELYDLYDLTIRRIVYEYKEAITKQFALSIPNERLLLAILGELNGDERIKALMWMVIETYQGMNVKSQEEVQIQKKLVQERNNNIRELNEKMTQKDHKILEMNRIYSEQLDLVEHIKKSFSYKVGRFITWIPRKVKRIIT